MLDVLVIQIVYIWMMKFLIALLASFSAIIVYCIFQKRQDKCSTNTELQIQNFLDKISFGS